MYRLVEPSRERMSIDRLVQSRQTNYFWQRVAMECIREQGTCLSHIADFFFFLPLVFCSVFLFHHVNYVYPQKDCLCSRVLRAFEQERQRKRKQRRTQQKRKKKSIDLQRKGRVWSASLAYMMNGREIGKATLGIFLLFNLSACFLLPPSYYCS